MINLEDYFDLVHSIANRFPQLEHDDAFQVGCVGLFIASQRFDESKEVKFSTYAFQYVFWYIDREVSQGTGCIRLPRAISKQNNKIIKLLNMGKTEEEISKELKIPTKNVKMYLKLNTYVSLDSKVFDDGEESLGDFLCESFTFEDELVNKLLLEEMLKKLTPYEKEMILLRFEGKTQSEVANYYGKSRQAISMAEKKVLRKLKKSLTN